MKWNKGRILLIVFLLVSIWFTALKVQEAQYIGNQYTTICIRFNGNGVTEHEIKAALENEKAKGTQTVPEITAWKWVDKTKVSNNRLNRRVSIAEIITAGNMAVTAPMKLMDGNYVTGEDPHGCVLDTASAYALFGTEKVIGNTVSVGNTEYIIRGIVETDYPVILFQGSKETLFYSNLEFTYDGSRIEMGERLASDFLFQNGLPTDFVIIDGYFYGKLLSCALCLPVWLFYFLIGLTAAIRYIRMKKHFTTKALLLYGLIGLVMMTGYGILLYSTVGAPFYLPEKIIPSKWSEFGYWEKLIDTLQGQFCQMKYLTPNSKDVFLKEEISRLFYNMAVLAVLYLCIYRWVYKNLNLNKKSN